MIKYTMILGLNDKDTKMQKISMADALNKLYRIIINYYHFSGATITPCNGIYSHDDNISIVCEQSIKIEIASGKTDDKRIYSFIRSLKKIYNQESIYYSKTSENIIFF